MSLTFDIIASLVLIFWIVQGIHTSRRIWSEGYSPLWWGGVGVLAMLLVMPLWALWL